MKKSLLSLALVALATPAFAEVEVGFLDAETLGLEGKPTLADNTLLASTASVEMFFAYGQETSKQQPDFNGMKTIVVNGQEIALVAGIGGTANGVSNLTDGPSAGGCIYNFKVKKNGWLIVPSKVSSNKNFYVYMGLVGQEPSPVAYTLGMDIQSDAYPDVNEINYSLPAGEFGLLNLEAANIADYTFDTNTIAWPIRIQQKNNEAASAGNGTGALVFPVYADAENYLVFATGSKMNTCGFIFVDSDPAGAAPSVSVTGIAKNTEKEKTVVITGNPSAVESIEAVTLDENAPIYNAQGIRVNADAKGLLIQNGKKFIRK